MSSKGYLACLSILALAFLPAIAHSLDLGTARLANVTASDGGCLSGPTGRTVQSWDIEPGHTYALAIINVTECANGGTDPTLDIRINSSIPGHEYTDLVATYVSPGVYQFDYTMPAEAWCTLPILYCTTPGEWFTTGLFVRRGDGGSFQAHLRASTWDEGCTKPVLILGPECGLVGAEESCWGAIKALYD